LLDDFRAATVRNRTEQSVSFPSFCLFLTALSMQPIDSK